MSSKLPVVAAIPNYNMASELQELLPLLIGQGYAAIFVLDDVSTDNSHEVVSKFGDKVTFVLGDQNRGAGVNRNRILAGLEYEALIHFIDADTRPGTESMPKIIQRSAPSADFAFMGGLAKTPGQTQSVWNYGPRPSLKNGYGAYCQYRFEQLLAIDRAQATKFRAKHAKLLAAWPNPLEAPVATDTFWCIEQNLVFRSDIFKRYGGFDESIRETEIVDLAHRMHADGLTASFDPSFSVIHTEVRVRAYNRAVLKRKESVRLAFRYGIIRWLLNR